jgi:hypothetical protein
VEFTEGRGGDVTERILRVRLDRLSVGELRESAGDIVAAAAHWPVLTST